MENNSKDLKIKILRKGDSVLNIFNYGENVAISVKRKDKSVDIILLSRRDDGIPEIMATWSICEGDGEIEFSANNYKISSF